jgi:hypothetical protein
MSTCINRRSWFTLTTSVIITAFMFVAGVSNTQAKPGKGKGPFNNTVDLTPTINSLQLVDGQLVASGTVTANVKGQTVTAPFTAPVTLALAQDPSAAAGDCPVLDLMIAPINLDLLGLVVQTSPICLQIVAHESGGLLGDLLCSVANLLNGGLDIGQILSGLGLVDPITGAVTLPGIDASQLLAGLTDLLNQALGNLLGSILEAIDGSDVQHTCGILHLELGPIDLTLLGLEVILDDCADGPVVVDVTAVTGKGNLLGNLLCELLGGNAINLGTTLQGILDQILALLG